MDVSSVSETGAPVLVRDVIAAAKAALDANDLDSAAAECLRVFRSYPRCVEAARVLGEAYAEQHYTADADTLFQFVLRADPHDVLGYVDRGFIGVELNRTDEAISFFERALELDPNIVELRQVLLNLHHERDNTQNARLRISKTGLANQRLRDGFTAQAIEEFGAILRETPERLDVRVHLVETHWRTRDYSRAALLAEALLRTNGDLVKPHYILWHIARQPDRRDAETAATHLRAAQALDPMYLIAERLFAETAPDVLDYLNRLPPAELAPAEVDEAGSGAMPVEIAGLATADLQAIDRELGLAPAVPPPPPVEIPATDDAPVDDDAWLNALMADTAAAHHVQETSAGGDDTAMMEGLAPFDLDAAQDTAEDTATSEAKHIMPFQRRNEAGPQPGVSVAPDAGRRASFARDEAGPLVAHSPAVARRESYARNEAGPQPAALPETAPLLRDEAGSLPAEAVRSPLQPERGAEPVAGQPPLMFHMRPEKGDEPAHHPQPVPFRPPVRGETPTDTTGFDSLTVLAPDTTLRYRDEAGLQPTPVETQPAPVEAAFATPEVAVPTPTPVEAAPPAVAAPAIARRSERGPEPAVAAAPPPTSGNLRSERGAEPDSPSVTASAAPPPDAAAQRLDSKEDDESMPINRKDDAPDESLFDWEREELPDYLRPFAVSVDDASQTPKAAQRGPAAPQPQTFDLGDDSLPSWLADQNPPAKAPARPAPPAVRRTDPPPSTGAGNTLPSWLDNAEFDDQPSPAAHVAATPAANTDLDEFDLGGMQPFDVGDTTPVAPLTPMGQRGNYPAPSPFHDMPIDEVDDLSAIQPFSPDDFQDVFGVPGPARPTLQPARPPQNPGINDISLDLPTGVLPFDPTADFGQDAPRPAAHVRPATPGDFGDFDTSGDFGNLAAFDPAAFGGPATPQKPAPTTDTPSPFGISGRDMLNGAKPPQGFDAFGLPSQPTPQGFAPLTGKLSDVTGANTSGDTDDFDFAGNLAPFAFDAPAEARPQTPSRPRPAEEPGVNQPLLRGLDKRRREAEKERETEAQGESLFARMAAQRRQHDPAQPTPPIPTDSDAAEQIPSYDQLEAQLDGTVQPTDVAVPQAETPTDVVAAQAETPAPAAFTLPEAQAPKETDDFEFEDFFADEVEAAPTHPPRIDLSDTGDLAAYDLTDLRPAGDDDDFAVAPPAPDKEEQHGFFHNAVEAVKHLIPGDHKDKEPETAPEPAAFDFATPDIAPFDFDAAPVPPMEPLAPLPPLAAVPPTPVQEAAQSAPQPAQPAPVQEATYKPDVVAQAKARPRDVAANTAAATTLMANGQHEDAIDHYLRVVRTLDPAHAQDLLGKLQDIAPQYEQNPRFHRLLGDTYLRLGQSHWAVSEYTKALQVGRARQ